MSDLAGFIDDLVRRRGVSLRRIAVESGVSASTLSRWIHGKQTPSPENCQRLAEYLSLPVEHLLTLAGHLVPFQKASSGSLPEFREYARQKYHEELDDDMVAMIEDLIYRRRRRREETRGTEGGSAHTG